MQKPLDTKEILRRKLLNTLAMLSSSANRHRSRRGGHGSVFRTFDMDSILFARRPWRGGGSAKISRKDANQGRVYENGIL
ncbi:hypothetical protein NPIL_576751 [Nephila pilipes]|uniref:Uncharacterized protein n=1 Tax=Nephila pilipes TaxID=299642 RepID=A0A8X6MX75_NEPPI|nr:hypothetical protein NPIL_576751 [Nephila pilipes]